MRATPVRQPRCDHQHVVEEKRVHFLRLDKRLWIDLDQVSIVHQVPIRDFRHALRKNNQFGWLTAGKSTIHQPMR